MGVDQKIIILFKNPEHKKSCLLDIQKRMQQLVQEKNETSKHLLNDKQIHYLSKIKVIKNETGIGDLFLAPPNFFNVDLKKSDTSDSYDKIYLRFLNHTHDDGMERRTINCFYYDLTHDYGNRELLKDKITKDNALLVDFSLWGICDEMTYLICQTAMKNYDCECFVDYSDSDDECFLSFDNFYEKYCGYFKQKLIMEDL